MSVSLPSDTKLCGAADTLERREGIRREFDGHERWACANLMRINQAKCRVVHRGRGNAKQKCEPE